MIISLKIMKIIQMIKSYRMNLYYLAILTKKEEIEGTEKIQEEDEDGEHLEEEEVSSRRLS
jgi:hypothetical protein